MIALRVAELRVLAATTAVVWGRSQSAPPARILTEASARTQGYLASLDRRSATKRIHQVVGGDYFLRRTRVAAHGPTVARGRRVEVVALDDVGIRKGGKAKSCAHCPRACLWSGAVCRSGCGQRSRWR